MHVSQSLNVDVQIKLWTFVLIDFMATLNPVKLQATMENPPLSTQPWPA
jgi:hypothetical protein